MIKSLLYSFLLTIFYFGISAFYFFGTYFDTNAQGVRELIDSILTYPAVMYFGGGFSGQTNATIFFMELKIFTPIWFVLFIIFLIVKKLRNREK